MCKLCEKKPVYEFNNSRKLCSNCYVRWFEKKFLFTIRKFSLFSRGDKLFSLNKSDFRSVVLNELLKIFKINNSKLVFLSKRQSGCKIILSTTADQIVVDFVGCLFNKNVKNFSTQLPSSKNSVRPLCLFLDKEVLLYANLKKFKFSEDKIIKKKLNSFIEDLEKKHPELKSAILQSYFYLESL